jgi:hypothetical protein
MTFSATCKLGAFSALTAAMLAATPACAELSAEELAKLSDDGPNWQIRAQVQFMFPK